MTKKRNEKKELSDINEILHPEIIIEKLKQENEELKRQLNLKEQQSGHRKKIIDEQSKIIKKLTGINILLEDERNSINRLKGILLNIPQKSITYKNNVELIELCLMETNKKFIIFCEGTKKSLDYKIYSILYPCALVIPYGSWSNIESLLKAYRGKSQIFYAVIDNDRRGNKLKEALIQEGIFCLNVRAIENLMFIDEIFIKIFKELKIENSEEKLNLLKSVAYENYCKIEDKYVCNKKNVLLNYPSKKILGLMINTLLDNKLSKYKEIFLKLITESDVIEILKKYTPIIIE